MRNRGFLQVAYTQATELSETLELWLTWTHLKSESLLTPRTYRKVVQPCIDHLHSQGITRLEAVEPKHLMNYFLMRKPKVRPATLAKDYRHLHAFFAWCTEQGLLERNPMEKVERPKVQVEPKPALTEAEIQKLLDATEGRNWLRLRDRSILLSLLDTGARLAEIHQLTVEALQRDSCLIRGKGGRWRTVYFSPLTRTTFAKYLKALPFPVKPESPAWWGKDGRPLTMNGLVEVLRNISRRSGVCFSAHTLRRTFAVEALRAGCDLERLRRMTGHTNLEVLRLHYLPLASEDVQQAHREFSPVNHLMRGRKRRE